MKARLVACVCAVALTASVRVATATPIVYEGDLVLTPASTVSGTLAVAGFFDEAAFADFWRFSAVAGQRIDIGGFRRDADYDMAFWIYRGVFSDTDQFTGGPFGVGTFHSSQAGYVGFFDDEAPAAIPGGPFGDPRATFIAPVTGLYTIAVTSNVSFGTGPYDYRLAAVPEAGTLILMGAGLTGIAAAARRRRRQHRG